ncbi:hypothetical protein GPECTOR_389g200 [Gonium pectorale]|uniref:Ubiquitin-like domain-containing protein n=1 Tax=Gonium pectorale TaxID=33097 RepID=A0A150FVE5_GONPE|nr:hypothetical protein GPECTOR_389g200 [Gonium pectorale]|eukprot:KXZ41567.1 hypothetical protein GPECTOR_389g200 [Gonium pectorale]
MRVFVRCADGAPVALDAGAGPEGGTLQQLQSAVEARLGVPAGLQFLTTLGGRPLRAGAAATLYDMGVREYDTLELSNIGASYCGSANNLYFATLPPTEAPTERKA